jgi:RHS repeat-associated protein
VRKVSGGATTIYAYDGQDIIEETDGAAVVTARYSQGLKIDEPLAQLRNGTTYFYSADGLGSITSLTDASGTVAASYTYDSFGNLTASQGSVVNPFRYTAREWEAETGLYFYRARYYDVGTGRFLSEDLAGFDTDLNFYPYVGNGPLSWTDPSGLKRAKVCKQGIKRFHGVLGWTCHTYIEIFNDDGSPLIDQQDQLRATYGILGDDAKGKAARKNQKVRKGDHRNNAEPKDCKELDACPNEVEKLHAGLQKAYESGTCPSCGKNYDAWKVTDLFHFLDGFNSNTFTFNMVEGAGIGGAIVPPKMRICPGYHHAEGPWY